MKLREVSDIHSEFFGEDEIAEYVNTQILPPLPDDHETILLMAGDIGSAEKPECLLNLVESIAPRFKQVLMIPGNHEYYFGNLQTSAAKHANLLAHIPNVKYNFATHQLGDDRKIIGFTMWTNFDNGNDKSMTEAEYRMNDYRLIRNGDRLMRAMDTYELHKATVAQLEAIIQPGDIVMTHHSPSLKSIPEEYLHDRVNGAYHSDLDDLIIRKKPAFWFHGHTHTAITYKLGDTTVVCNPRGYGNQHRKNGYNPELVVEI